MPLRISGTGGVDGGLARLDTPHFAITLGARLFQKEPVAAADFEDRPLVHPKAIQARQICTIAPRQVIHFAVVIEGALVIESGHHARIGDRIRPHQFTRITPDHAVVDAIRQAARGKHRGRERSGSKLAGYNSVELPSSPTDRARSDV